MAESQVKSTVPVPLNPSTDPATPVNGLHPAQQNTHPFAAGIPFDRWRLDDLKRQAEEFRTNMPAKWLEEHAKQKWLGTIATKRGRYGWRSL